jgi:molybdopterin-binding protein
MKLSARNKLAGTVTAIEKGAVNATVQIDLGGGTTVTAMITNASVADLDLEVGKTAYAIVKASDVIVGAD